MMVKVALLFLLIMVVVAMILGRPKPGDDGWRGRYGWLFGARRRPPRDDDR